MFSPDRESWPHCTGVVGILPNEAAITRLIGAIVLEQNDDGPSSAAAT